MKKKILELTFWRVRVGNMGEKVAPSQSNILKITFHLIICVCYYIVRVFIHVHVYVCACTCVP